MRLIKNRAIINNQWRLDRDDGDRADVVGGDDANAVGGDNAVNEHIIMPLARWLAMRGDASARGVGVLLQPDDRVEDLADDLNRIALIALEFGAFNEGRGYSQAARLRRQHHFRGEIRALGAHRDNLPLMERCGIDAYELVDGEDLAESLSAFEEITEYYEHAPRAVST
ncbi:MAG: DUF934 domain-containing protein [bacterium]